MKNWTKIENEMMKETYTAHGEKAANYDELWLAFLDRYEAEAEEGDLEECSFHVGKLCELKRCEDTDDLQVECQDCEDCREGREFDRAVERGDIIKDPIEGWIRIN